MGFRAVNRFEQIFSNQRRVTIRHNLGLEYPGVRVLINNEVSPESVVGVKVAADDPTNAIVVLLDGNYSGVVQISTFDIQPPGIQSATILDLNGESIQINFGDNYTYEEDLTRSTVTGTTDFIQKLRLNVTTTADIGKYRIAASFTWDYSSASNDFLARIEQNNSIPRWAMREEPTDTAITQQRYAEGKAQMVLSAGSYTFDLDFATSIAAQTAGIDQARLEFWRI